MKAIITGVTGYLGAFLAKELIQNEISIVAITRASNKQLLLNSNYKEVLLADFNDYKVLDSVICLERPDFIIHAAAISRVDVCEDNSGIAMDFNTHFSIAFANAAHKQEVFFVYISTDLVFEGYQAAPSSGFSEVDLPKPVHIYASSKHAAEVELLKLNNVAVVRTSLITGPYNQSGGGSILENFKNGNKVSLFYDEFRTPIHVADLSCFLRTLGERKKTGLFHAAGPEKISRFDLGEALARAYNYPLSLINKASRLSYVSNPPRAPDVALDNTKAERELNYRFKKIGAALIEYARF
ncbi:MAG: SDR family oxidoreductase [Bdellovibrionales bacterium]|nr:SDR family oxidoreductase [Bdellovibrionales bacterium]